MNIYLYLGIALIAVSSTGCSSSYKAEVKALKQQVDQELQNAFGHATTIAQLQQEISLLQAQKEHTDKAHYRQTVAQFWNYIHHGLKIQHPQEEFTQKIVGPALEIYKSAFKK